MTSELEARVIKPACDVGQLFSALLGVDETASHSSITTAASAEDLAEDFGADKDKDKLPRVTDPFEASGNDDVIPLVPLRKRSVSAGDLPVDADPYSVVTPSEVILILDWDDTLFPSTWLHRRAHEADCPASIDQLASAAFTAQDLDLLEALDASVYNFLQECDRLGHVIVVTNAETGWVEQTASRFLPTVYQWLLHKQTNIVSARACFTAKLATSDSPDLEEASAPDLWKAHTFNMVVKNVIYDRFLERRRKHFLPPLHRSASRQILSPKLHFVSVGDSECERRALLTCRERFFPHGYFKSIKLLEAPDIDLLLQQHNFLLANISQIIYTCDCLDLLIDPSI